MDFRIAGVRKIFSNGRHNAFTGIASFRGKVYVTFRCGANHVSPDGQIRVIASRDLKTWDVVAERSHPELDLRDPKLVVFRDRLFVYYYSSARDHSLKSWAFSSADGARFGAEQPLTGGPGGRVLWWMLPRDGVLYGAAYLEKERFCTTSLYASDDGLAWRDLLDFPVRNGNEVSFDFDAEGRMWALVRTDFTGNVPTLCTARPPYTGLDSAFELPLRLQGPLLKRFPEGCLIVARRWDEPGRHGRRTDMLWLPDGGDARFLRTLPSGGDTSYAGWLELEPGRAAMSYYSSHEHKMDEPFGKNWEHDTPADIFLAEVLYR